MYEIRVLEKLSTKANNCFFPRIIEERWTAIIKYHTIFLTEDDRIQDE